MTDVPDFCRCQTKTCSYQHGNDHKETVPPHEFQIINLNHQVTYWILTYIYIMTEKVKVVVRVRPLNELEKSKTCKEVISIDNKIKQINLTNTENKELPKNFAYDNVFGPESTQLAIYQETCFGLVQSVAEGYNGTIFAYGQTGCGKTHTMIGNPFDSDIRGIIPRTFEHLIQLIQAEKDKTFLMRCSFIEIYNEQIHDLLGKDIKQRKEIKESTDKGVYIKNLTIPVVKDFNDMNKKLQIGFKNRYTAATAMNKDSSRSHSVFTIHVETQEGESFKGSKLNLVDLAGSERQSKTHATGDRLKQAAKINLSLSALGNVICALVDAKSKHIPYRDSKLTRLLEDSLGGNTKTTMIANVSPSSYNYQETLSTLRYASRAKKITNKPIINEDPKDALLRQYAEEIELLRKQLEGKAPAAILTNQTIEYVQRNDSSTNEEKQLLMEKIKELEGQVMKSHEKTDNKKYKDLKIKLKKERVDREQILEQARKAEEELFSVNENFKNAQEMSQKYKEALIVARKKYKAAIIENNDLEKEHLWQKEILTDEIRETQLERDFYEQVCLKLLTRDQLEQVREKSKYNEDKMKYKVPVFLMKAKQINFPKINQKNAEDLLKHQHESIELSFEDRATKLKSFNKDSPFHPNSQKYIITEENRLDRKRIKTIENAERHQKRVKNIILAPLKTEVSYEEQYNPKGPDATSYQQPTKKTLFGFPFK